MGLTGVKEMLTKSWYNKRLKLASSVSKCKLPALDPFIRTSGFILWIVTINYSPPKLTPGTILYYFQTSGENVKRFLAWFDKFEGSKDASDSAGSPTGKEEKKIKIDTTGRLIR